MIVRNEAHVIDRCLASIRPLIDSWIIVDTGSTDGTQTIIGNFLTDLPGALYERPWKNFGHNRTEALTLARGRSDYLLFIDADDRLEIIQQLDKSELTADGYLIQLLLGHYSYRLPMLVSQKFDWRYEGVLHEYITCDAPHRFEKLDDIAIRICADGARSQGKSSVQKYAGDARILEDALKAEPNNSRNVFYLAQSYRDSNQFHKSLDAYLRRARMEGWDEEVWYSLFEAAKLSERLKLDPALVIYRYLEAYNARPHRAEPLVELARWCRERQQYPLAFLFASRAVTIPVPKDTLFVDIETYSWRALDEFAVACYWTGEFSASAKACEKLLESSATPGAHLARIAGNLGFARAKFPSK